MSQGYASNVCASVDTHPSPRWLMRPPFRKLLSTTASLLLLFVLVPPARSDDYTWESDVTGDWGDAALWQPDGIPGPGDTAEIAAAGFPYTVTLDRDIALNGFSTASHEATLFANGRRLTVFGPSILTAGSVIWRGSSWTGNDTLTNDASMTIQGASTIGLTFQQNGYLLIEGSGAGGHADLTTMGISTNSGTVRLESSDSTYSSDLTIEGTFINEPAGLIEVELGSGGTRIVRGNLTNEGQIVVGVDALLRILGPGTTYTAAGGTIDGHGRIENATLCITASPPAPSTIEVTSSGSMLCSDVLPDYEVWVHGQAGTSHALLASSGSFANQGAIRLESSDSSYESNLALTIGTLTNAVGGLIQANVGSGGERKIRGNITNRGEINVADGSTLLIDATTKTFRQESGIINAVGTFRMNHGTFEFIGGSTSGYALCLNSIVNVADSVDTPSTLFVGGNSVLLDNESEYVTVEVQGSDAGSHAELTTVGTAANWGTLRLNSIDAGYDVDLTIEDAFVNESGALLEVQKGAGGHRIIRGNFTNKGQISVGGDALLRILGPGTTYTATGGTIDGPGRIENATLCITESPVDPSTLEVTGLESTVCSDILPRYEVWIHGQAGTGHALLTASGSFVNQGTLTLESDDGGYRSNLTVSPGTLTNADIGTIQANPGSGGERKIRGHVTNRGDINVADGTTLLIDAVARTFRQEEGAINALGTFRMNNGSFEFTGGSTSGYISLLNATVNIADTVNTPSSVFLGGNCELLDNASDQVTVEVQGSAAGGHTECTTVGATSNLGTMRLKSIDGAYSSNVRIEDTLVNEAGGLIDVQKGTGGDRLVSGTFTNKGQIVVAADSHLRILGAETTYTAAGGTIDGPGRIENATLCITASPTAPSTIEVTGPQSVLCSDILSDYEVWVHGRGGTGHALLTSPGGFENRGAITLESSGGGWQSNLTISTGALVNTSSGSIVANLGSGGERKIRGNITNQGDIEIAEDTTLLIDALAKTFRQESGAINAAGTFRMDNGTFEFVGGSTAGPLGLVNSYVHVLDTVSTASELYLTGESGILQQSDSDQVTINVNGGLFGSHSTVYVAPDIDNSGTIIMQSIGGGYRSHLGLLGGFTNAPDGHIIANRGSGGTRQIEGSMTNDGRITVGEDTTLAITGEVTNCAGAILAGGVYTIAGTLKFANAQIAANAADLTLDGPNSAVRDTANNDALGNFNVNTDGGSFTLLNGRDFTRLSSFENAGEVLITEDSTFTTSTDYVQTDGLTTVNGTLATTLGRVDLTNGVLSGEGTVEGDVESFDGTVAPGYPVGILFVDGDYTHVQVPCGDIHIELGGSGPFDYDQLVIHGHAQIAGTLQIRVVGGFQPSLGEEFSILRAASLSGTFDEVEGACIGGGLVFDVIYSVDSVVLQVIEGECPDAPMAASYPRSSLPAIQLSSSNEGEVAVANTSTPCSVPPITPSCETHPDWVHCQGQPTECQDVCCTDLPGDTCPGCNPPICEVPELDELSCEIATLNAGPVPQLGLDWQPITCRTSCEHIYNSSLEPLPTDAVTYDNTSPAFYRWTFDLPDDARFPSLEGSVNCDDQCVAFLNDCQVTGTMGCWTWGVQPGLPHPPQDSHGRLIMNWPTLDPFQTADASCFAVGETNELVFAVSGSSSVFNPSGVEFEAVVSYVPFDCTIDTDGDGLMDCEDPCPLYDDRIDCNSNGVADGCDIHVHMTSEDCNSDEIPDECQFPPEPPLEMDWDMAVLLDGSGSIGAADFELITEGLALALEDPDIIPHDGSVTLAVIQFAGDLPTGARVELGPVNIDSPVTALSLAADVRAILQVSGGTPLGEGIDLAVDTILPGRPEAQHVITLLTDGVANGARDPVLAADDAIGTGIDEIDAIAVGGFDLSELDQVVRPQPNTPGPPASPGFVAQAGSFEEVEESFGSILETVLNSLIIVTRTVPSPVVGEPYDVELLAANACGSTSWALLGGELPAGFIMTGDGHIIGLGDRCGAYSFEVQVIDEAGAMASRRLGFAVMDPLDDGDVDLEDAARFQMCLAGTDVPVTEPMCRCLDIDADDDIDLDDLPLFVEALSSSGPQ